MLDSTPGDNGSQSAILANTPKTFLPQIIAIPWVALVYCWFYLINRLKGNRPIFEELRSTLLECDVLPPFTTKQVVRLYVYSEADRITLAKNVRRHIDQAQAIGLDVAVERFEKSPHVAHARSDPERYWTAVRNVWERAVELHRDNLN